MACQQTIAKSIAQIAAPGRISDQCSDLIDVAALVWRILRQTLERIVIRNQKWKQGRVRLHDWQAGKRRLQQRRLRSEWEGFEEHIGSGAKHRGVLDGPSEMHALVNLFYPCLHDVFMRLAN